ISAVSNSVTPRSIALWITLREVSRSVRWPKLLQPRPTAETRRPEPPRLRICMGDPVGVGAETGRIVARPPRRPQGAVLPRMACLSSQSCVARAIPVLTRFLHANRRPLRLETLWQLQRKKDAAPV